MKFKMSFEPELKKTIEIILRNEAENFEEKLDKSKSVKKLGQWSLRKKMATPFKPVFFYDVYNDYAEIEIVTGFDMFANTKRILKAFYKYEKISKGKIKVELIEK